MLGGMIFSHTVTKVIKSVFLNSRTLFIKWSFKLYIPIKLHLRRLKEVSSSNNLHASELQWAASWEGWIYASLQQIACEQKKAITEKENVLNNFYSAISK